MAEDEPEPGSDGGVEQLDAGFVLDTGYDPDEFPPPSQPWYRSPGAVTAISAIGVAVVALTVSAVLLVTRPEVTSGEDSVEPDSVSSDLTSSSTSAVTTTPLTTTPPPPPPSEIAPPPPEVTEEPAYTPTEDDEESREDEEEASEEAEESAEESAEEDDDDRPIYGETRTNITRSPATRTQISILPPG